ncbi:MAG: hypothetical protein KIT35_00775 [Piscinibacter sp.]|uniref:hypothetical protein n=1 Tax=Piscinibacter sp. TaxID=1903157 RepID=UPI00258C75F0|nr:hypothetical protein [Piscinibacter sp.]MCW5662344.1 hypothetical protein [Piscinibacter sp.]
MIVEIEIVWSQTLSSALSPLSRSKKPAPDAGYEITMACLPKGRKPKMWTPTQYVPSAQVSGHGCGSIGVK